MSFPLDQIHPPLLRNSHLHICPLKPKNGRLPPISLLTSIILSIPRPIIHPSTRLAVYSSSSPSSTCTRRKRAILRRLVVLVSLSLKRISIPLRIPLTWRIDLTVVVVVVGVRSTIPRTNSGTGTSHQRFHRRTGLVTPLQSRLGRSHGRHWHRSAARLGWRGPIVRISVCWYVFCISGGATGTGTSTTATGAIDAARDEKQDGEDDQPGDDCDWDCDLEVLSVPCGNGSLP